MNLRLLPRRVAAVAATAAIVAGALLVPATAAHAARTLDASNERPVAAQRTFMSRWAQTFTAQRSGSLTSLEVRNNGGGSIAVVAVSGGQPSGFPANAQYAGANGDGFFRYIYNDSPVQVIAGQQYAILGTGSISVSDPEVSDYPGGALLDEDGGGWTDVGADLIFRVYLDDDRPTIAAASFELRRGEPASGARLQATPDSANLTVAPNSKLPAGLSLQRLEDGWYVTGTPTANGSFTTRLRALTPTGFSTERTVGFEVRSVPGAPTQLAASGLDGGIRVTWSAPTDSGNAGTLRYRVRAIDTTTSSLAVDEETTANAITLAGLDNAHDYRLEVTAVNDLGAGGASAIAASPPAAPSAPRSMAVEEHDGYIVVTWEPPVSDGGSPILRYEAAWPGEPTRTVTSPYRVEGANGVGISTRIYAVNRSRSGAHVIARGIPRTVPDAPAVSTLSPSAGRVELAWTAPSWNGGAAITAYTVEHRRLGAAVWQSSESLAAAARSLVVSGLEDGAGYEFRIRAHNAAGASAPSSARQETPFRAPDAPGLQLRGQGDGTIELGWTAPAFDGGRAIEGWILEHRAAGGSGQWQQSATLPVGTRSTTFEDLEPGTLYEFRVRAENPAGRGEPSQLVEARFAVAAGEPRSVTALAGDGEVALSWLPPTSTGGSEPTRYEVRWGTPGTPSGGTQIVIGTSTRIRGLGNGAPVVFDVRAVTAAGPGAAAAATASPFAFAPTVHDLAGAQIRETRRGERIVLRAAGLPEGATVEAEFHSNPSPLGEAVIGPNGLLVLEGVIPDDAELAGHRIVLTLVAEGSLPRNAELPIRVIGPGGSDTSPSDQPAGSGVDPAAPAAGADAGAERLASTGGDAAPLGLAALLLGLGVLLVRRARRRAAA
ncbi:fibronectin type III domain-containing protein [Homoserinibacter sp. YIM 151385]|uniref:fibronectin type III domain-containing protein n=1 Tax=Homoserinibacter sp. YIM 151385 TaxID=2985506 RepID=UPI0022F06E49|nr:fibronectin type III domain-containing protein [Homoserinibacter sp. YIM 151385]WBU37321.1 fibronectin type III domain-containing protein [Homoserinibacter sp. YIM 151385]